MESTIGVSELAQILQCAVCLETVYNPKVLRCNHSYCKQCLDPLITFVRGHGGIIKCPKGCAKHTKIPANSTTDDLGVDYMLKGILEKVEAKEGTHEGTVTCCSCNKEVRRYCRHCQVFRCLTCGDPHSTGSYTDGTFIPVSYNLREKAIKVMCHVHNSAATHICCKDQFICVYCCHRSHLDHEYDTLDDAEKKLRGVVASEVKTSDALRTGWLSLKDDIATARANLSEMLRLRKIKCMEDHIALLDKEEESIKQSFEKVVLDHSKPFVTVESTDYYNQCLAMGQADFLLRKSDIQQRIFNNIQSTREVTVSLGKHATTWMSTDHGPRPLGVLHCHYGRNIQMGKVDTSKRKTFKSKIDVEKDGVDVSLVSLCRLKELFENAYHKQVDDKMQAEQVCSEDVVEIPDDSSSSSGRSSPPSSSSRESAVTWSNISPIAGPSGRSSPVVQVVDVTGSSRSISKYTGTPRRRCTLNNPARYVEECSDSAEDATTTKAKKCRKR